MFLILQLRKMSYLSCRSRIKGRKLRGVLKESILDSESDLLFHPAPWCLYLIPPVLDPYLLLSQTLAAPSSASMSLPSPYVADSLCLHVCPGNLGFLTSVHLVHYCTLPATKEYVP